MASHQEFMARQGRGLERKLVVPERTSWTSEMVFETTFESVEET